MSDEPRDLPALRRAVDSAAKNVGPPPPGRGLHALRHGLRLRRRALAARIGGIVVGLGTAAGVVALLVGALGGIEGRGSAGGPACGDASTVRFSELGAVGYVRDGALHVADVSEPGDDRVIVPSGVSGPIRWGPFGQWVAYQDATGTVSIIPATGGQACQPLGDAVSSWTWSSSKPILVGVTPGGGVVTGGPETKRTSLQRDGWGAAGAPVFDPSGVLAAVVREVAGEAPSLWTVDRRNGATRRILEVSSQGVIPVPVAWSPDGRWILFWADTPGDEASAADGVPLQAISIEDGTSMEVVPSMLRHPDFLSACRPDVAIAAGAGADVADDKLIEVAHPPEWTATPVRTAQQLGGPAIWPACTRDGDLVATSVLTGPSNTGRPLDQTWRVWIYVKLDDRSLLATDPGPGFSDEAPRWAHDGRYVMFVRRDVGTERGRVYLLRFGEGFAVHEVSRIADLGPVPNDLGYADWSAAFDWFQPGR
jgi:hypothetical protein